MGHSFMTFLVDKLHLHRVRLFIVAYMVGYIIRAKKILKDLLLRIMQLYHHGNFHWLEL